jgi:hypothetical protein
MFVCGCGNSTLTVEEHTASTSTKSAIAVKTAHPTKPKYDGLDNPAQKPDPDVTAYCNEVPEGHPCHAITASPSDPNESPQRNCDAQIVANSETSCAFAENAFYDAYRSSIFERPTFSIEAYSPSTHKNYELFCEHSASPLIGCISSPTADGIYISFPRAALIAYTESQADAYAASHQVGNPPPPAAESSKGHTSTPEPEQESNKPEPEQESAGEDEVGSYSHASDESFCNEHNCIGEFESEDGYIVECTDGSYSHADGKSGACSDHGGEAEG